MQKAGGNVQGSVRGKCPSPFFPDTVYYAYIERSLYIDKMLDIESEMKNSFECNKNVRLSCFHVTDT